MTFNDLLDLFEAYVSTIYAPLDRGCDMIKEQLDYHEGEIFGHIVGVVDDADQMAKRLNQIRTARNSGDDVTVTMSSGEAKAIEDAADSMQHLLSEAAETFDLLHVGISLGHFAGDDPGPLSVMSLAHRAFRAAAEGEGETLAGLGMRLRKEKKSHPTNQEDAA